MTTGIRYDLRDGMELLTTQVCNTAISLVNQSITNLIIGVIIFAFAILISMLFNAIPWMNDIVKISRES
jgi:hypothetical protein